jgi:hypothetical protein
MISKSEIFSQGSSSVFESPRQSMDFRRVSVCLSGEDHASPRPGVGETLTAQPPSTLREVTACIGSVGCSVTATDYPSVLEREEDIPIIRGSGDSSLDLSVRGLAQPIIPRR